MIGWHHLHNGHRFGWTPGIGDGQGGLAGCGSWGHKESNSTEQLNRTESTGVLNRSSLIAQLVNNPPAMQETPV